MQCLFLCDDSTLHSRAVVLVSDTSDSQRYDPIPKEDDDDYLVDVYRHSSKLIPSWCFKTLLVVNKG